MRVYEFEHETGIFIGIKIDYENRITITVRNVISYLEKFFESAVVGDDAIVHKSRIIMLKLVHFFKQVFNTEKEYNCGTDERLINDIRQDYPMLYTCIESAVV